MFLEELKKFSKNNYWVYILLIIALILVYITGKGNLIEIALLFMSTFLWNLLIMVMQKNYSAKKNKIWAVYHVLAVITFSLIAIYWYFILKQSQYLIWQVTYILAATKAFTLYNYWKNIDFLNHKSIWIINIILLFIYLFIYWNNLNNFWEIAIFSSSFIMAIWFSFVTTWLVSSRDTFRYWANLFWVFFIVIWALIAIILGYMNWNIDWLSLWYFILTFTVLVYYFKLLKKYI